MFTLIQWAFYHFLKKINFGGCICVSYMILYYQRTARTAQPHRLAPNGYSIGLHTTTKQKKPPEGERKGEKQHEID